jgi:hypothetical protein
MFNNNNVNTTNNPINTNNNNQYMDKDDKYIDYTDEEIAIKIWNKSNPKFFNPTKAFIYETKFNRIVDGTIKSLYAEDIIKFLENPEKDLGYKYFADEVDDFYRKRSVGTYIMKDRLLKRKHEYIEEIMNEINYNKITKKLSKADNTKNIRDFKIYLQELECKYGSTMFDLILTKIKHLYNDLNTPKITLSLEDYKFP